MSNKNEDENLQMIFDKYHIYSNFNKNYNIFKSLYDDIKSKYGGRLNGMKKQEKLSYIEFERYRLENNKIEISSNPCAIAVSILAIIISILAVFISLNDSLLINTIITRITLFVIVAVLFWLGLKMIGYAQKEKIYDVAIKVLNDKEKKVKDEPEIECEEIEKEISSKNCVNPVAVVTNDNHVNGKLMIKNVLDGLKKWCLNRKLKKCRNWYITEINTEKKDYNPQNFDTLIYDIKDYYTNHKDKAYCKKKMLEVDNDKSTLPNVSFTSYIYSLLTVFALFVSSIMSFIIFRIQKQDNANIKKVLENISTFEDVLMIVTSVMLIIVCLGFMIDVIISMNYKKRFHLLCLSILNDIDLEDIKFEDFVLKDAEPKNIETKANEQNDNKSEK